MKRIKLTQNKVALIDDEDFELVNQYKWRLWKSKNKQQRYAIAHNKKNTLRMHRLILNITDTKVHIDHKNNNGLDNRKTNLRICSNRENCYNQQKSSKNTTGYKGVTKICNPLKPWTAQIRVNYQIKYLGVYRTAKDAAKAYDKAAIKLFGEFARLNFPKKEVV